MKKKIVSILVCLCLILSMLPLQASAAGTMEPEKPQGVGTIEQPYKISNAKELFWFSGVVNGTLSGVSQNREACAILTADITINPNVVDEEGKLVQDVSGLISWCPIGDGNSCQEGGYNEYRGVFDGKNHVINGLYFADSGRNQVGIFGLVKGGKISNLTLCNSWFEGGYNVGGICGSAYGNSQILNCRNEATIFGFRQIGGIAGKFTDGSIEKSVNLGTIGVRYNDGAGFCGGIAGSNDRGVMKYCWNVGTINCVDISGGLAGENTNKSTISDSYNYGKVTGTKWCGAITGKNYSTGNIENCYYEEGSCTKGIGTDYGPQKDIHAQKEAEFQSGEVCSLLNKGITDGSQAWYQNLDNSQKTDLYPRLSGGTVYKNGTSFSNTKKNIIQIAIKEGVQFNKIYDGNPISTPNMADLVITGQTSQKPTFTWYQVSDKGLVELTKAPTNIGTYKVKISIEATAQSTGASIMSEEIIIARKDLQQIRVELSQELYKYDGSEKKPEVKVYDGNSQLSTEYYSVTYSNNIEGGVASVIVQNTDKSNYSFLVTKEFKIIVNIEDITIKAIDGIIQKTFDARKFELSTERGVHLKWNSPEPVKIEGYYLDQAGKNPIDKDNSAPVNPGFYYAKVFVQIGESCSQFFYIPIQIVDQTGFPFPGNGTAAKPYEIHTEQALDFLAQWVIQRDDCSGRYFQLCKDFTYRGRTVGKDSSMLESKQFCGIFDGNGHTLDLNLERQTARTEQALFGKLGNGATIMNLYVSGKITSHGKYVGGIVGTIDGVNVNILNCTSDVNLFYGNASYVPDCTYGGIVGRITESSDVVIRNCNFTGSISGYPKRVIEGFGGLCGWNAGKTKIENCYVDGDFGASKTSVKGSYLVRNGALIRNCFFNIDNNLVDDQSGTMLGLGMQTSDFSNGKVAYLLNDQVHNGTLTVWGQGLAGDKSNADPVLLFQKGDNRNLVHRVLLVPGPGLTGGLPVNMSGDYYVNANLQLPQLTEEQKEQGYSYAIQNDKTAATLDSTRNCIENIQEDLTVQVLLKRPQMYRIQCEVGSVKGGTVEGIRESGYQYNEEATLTVQTLPGFLFVGWKNQNGEIVSTKENYQFKVTDHHSLTVLFVEKKAEETYHTVEFYHQAGNLLKADKVIKNQTVIPPNTPTKAGFDFIGWSADGINPMATNADGSITIASNYTLRPLFKAKEETFKVFVNGNQQGSYKLMTQVTVQILAEQIPEGKQFAYWTDQAGNIVSYNNPYQFYLTGETSLIPVYQDKIAEVKKMPTLHLSAPVYEGVTAGKHKMTWFSTIDLPENYTVVDCGVLRMLSNNALPNELMNMNTSGIFKRQIQLSSSMPNQYYYSVTAADGRGISLRAYMVVKNPEGVYETIYSQVEFGCYK